MKPLSIPLLVVVLAAATGFGTTLAQLIASRGGVVPITGWLTGLLLLALTAVLIVVGLPLRRYLKESEERSASGSFAPRRHQLDMITAYRVVTFARACAYTGVLVGGAHLGIALHLGPSGIGSMAGAVLPTLFAGVCGIVLAVAGVVVERWGKLPPEEGDPSAESSPA
ncbi:DUF3180 domain-containing protein [Brachybacterium hainanense]|uniref:DUF3180 domain-containing protein n=1 Tax=Brachybacterium hainanense TaxID=1541174 RepID=A0ABV6RDX6_9MICO